ncbi:inactive TPR repeat-containing thioredoxin TTL3-like [Cynara cardunculus var. scolymus]|uniref:Tetratricopeptide-like helical n=1 Tax=Cynara cardunculus var. scolymus TaxID=59895 RepID=A0A118K4C5_CYNCS|nr:inactive TPR repeat-containing thioredoxin TTL3-like [Cynara cardunculus var. scolymus]KVI07260.1 Tetratricopeptide-like helical [Cynara cardunculus var. scolymus]
MAETPKHIAGKDNGCGFIGAIFGNRPRKTPPVPRLEASKEHRRTQFSGNHTSKKPQRTHSRTTTAGAGEIVYTGFSKPVAKNPPPQPQLKTRPPTAVKKPATVRSKPVKPPYDSISKSALYSVSQVTNISYTKQLRKEPSFTSSELSLRISVRGKPNPNGSTYRASSNHVMVPGHLGNLMKKKPEKTQTYGKLGNIYGNLPKKWDPEAFKNLGNDKYKQGRFDEAIALYTEAIRMDSTIASYYSNRSAALIGLGKLVDAILDCKIAIRIDPSYHRAHYRLASLYLRFGEAEKALCHYKCSGEKAERLDFGKVQAAKAQLVTCLGARKIKDWKKLLKESQFAFSLGVDSSIQVYAMQAEALLNLHRHEEAYFGFQNAPVMDVGISAQLFGSTVTANFLTVQAQVYLASGRFEEAVSGVLRAYEIDPSEEVFVIARKTRALARARATGNKIFKGSQFSEACNVYSEGLEHEPYNSVLLCNRAACRYKLGQFERAVEDCTVALSLRPSYGKARLRRAECNAKLERWESAIQDYEVLDQETIGGEEVKQALLEARMQLEKQHVADAKFVKLIDGANREKFGGFLIAV